MLNGSNRTGGGTSSRIVLLSGLTIIAIAIFQTITNGGPDPYTIGALAALALGGGVGSAADKLIKGYVQSQIESSSPPDPPPPSPTGGEHDG